MVISAMHLQASGTSSEIWRNNSASGLCTFLDCGCRNLSVMSPNGRRYWICERVNAFAFVRSTYTPDLNFWRTTTSKPELDMRRVHPRVGSQNWHMCMGRVHCSKCLLEFTICRPMSFWTYQPVVWVYESIHDFPQWRSNRVSRVCKAHGPTATGGPTDATLLYFVHTNTGRKDYKLVVCSHVTFLLWKCH